MTRATTIPLRNAATVGKCEAPAAGGGHCDQEARLYPCGWRCPEHSPVKTS